MEGEVAQHQTVFLPLKQSRGMAQSPPRPIFGRPADAGKRSAWDGLFQRQLVGATIGRPCPFSQAAPPPRPARQGSRRSRLLRPVRHHAGEIRDAAIDQLVLRVIGLMIRGFAATTLTMGETARPASRSMAMRLPKPLPTCRSVKAGVPVMRA